MNIFSSIFTTKNPAEELKSLDKSLEILKKRYERKEITLDYFSKTCQELGKRREKIMKKLNK